jgi:hypothetical protein
MATRVDIRADWFTGEDKSVQFTVYQHHSTTAQNITGWALSWTVKRTRTGTALLTKTTSDDIALTTAASGICTVTVSDADISTLDGEVQYWHELKRTDAGNETVLSQGTFTLGQALHD